MVDYAKITSVMADLEEDDLNALVDEAIAEGAESARKALVACQDGITEVGKRFETGEYFVGDMIYAGEILNDLLVKLKPILNDGGASKRGKVILCSVESDLHDIGKNIVKGMLEANGFEVVDLGVDVAPATIVDAAKKDNIKIVLLSGVLTLALDSMKNTVNAFKDAGIRDQVKILVGGLPVNKDTGLNTGADEWAFNPQKTVDTCIAWDSAN